MHSINRPLKRGVVVAALVVLAIGLDAATGFNVALAASCVGYILLQFLAVTAGVLLAAGGLLVWIASRFKSDRALHVAAGALALIVAALLLKQVFGLIGLACIG